MSIHRGLFNTRNRAEHTRKRKLVSHTFAPKSVLEFEPYIHQNLELWVKQWDAKIKESTKGDGSADMDCLSWCSFPRSHLILDHG